MSFTINGACYMVSPWPQYKMVNANNYDGYSSDMTNQRLKDGEKILQRQIYHNIIRQLIVAVSNVFMCKSCIQFTKIIICTVNYRCKIRE